jgi:hypothetical protein
VLFSTHAAIISAAVVSIRTRCPIASSRVVPRLLRPRGLATTSFALRTDSLLQLRALGLQVLDRERPAKRPQPRFHFVTRGMTRARRLLGLALHFVRPRDTARETLLADHRLHLEPDRPESGGATGRECRDRVTELLRELVDVDVRETRNVLARDAPWKIAGLAPAADHLLDTRRALCRGEGQELCDVERLSNVLCIRTE